MKSYPLSTIIVFLVILMPVKGFSGGSLVGVGTCPAPSITGYTAFLVFTLQGPDPNPNGVITVVTGSCNMNGGDMPPVSIFASNTKQINVTYNYYSNAFAGLPISNFVGSSPSDSFILSMRYPGTYGEPTNADPGICTINVSWEIPAPPSTLIIGPDEIKIFQIVSLDGSISGGTIYNWSVTGDCSIEGDTQQSTVQIKGTQAGSCVVRREACDSLGDCVTNTHNITVLDQHIPLQGIIYLLWKQ